MRAIATSPGKIAALTALLLGGCADSEPDEAGVDTATASSRAGNVIFVHPDGTGLNHWTAARAYWRGPDGLLAWDRLPALAVYRGHMADQLVGTSNGAATTHGFGVRVAAAGSYGRDGKGEASRVITAASGFRGSVMREAAHRGYPVGVVNDGDLAEPGTGAFLAEATSRYDTSTIAEQILFGRPDAQDPPPAVVLGGGERFLLPEGTPACGRRIRPDCAVHVDPVTGAGPSREDGRNLVAEAEAAGWTVIRTRVEFDRVVRRVARDEDYLPRLLGLFAADDIFNDVPEERLIEAGLVREQDNGRAGRLIHWGGLPTSPSADPPTAREMTELAITLLERRARLAALPFLLVVEVESTDNLANANSGIGALRALARADDVIAAATEFATGRDDTLILVAADSDAGGLQLAGPPPTQDDGRVTGLPGNPTDRKIDRQLFAVDGVEGRATAPFEALPDAAGHRSTFAVAWSGGVDVAGGVLARAGGLNSELLGTEYRGLLDNTQVYELIHRTLFGDGGS
jgi:alkaline phosphatase